MTEHIQNVSALTSVCFRHPLDKKHEAGIIRAQRFCHVAIGVTVSNVSVCNPSHGTAQIQDVIGSLTHICWIETRARACFAQANEFDTKFVVG
jgi:hypothetical protein